MDTLLWISGASFGLAAAAGPLPWTALPARRRHVRRLPAEARAGLLLADSHGQLEECRETLTLVRDVAVEPLGPLVMAEPEDEDLRVLRTMLRNEVER